MIISKENSPDKITKQDTTDQIMDNNLACQGPMPQDRHVKGKQTLPYNCECVS